ncbi:hypothetical protein [Jatrophihabitans fulvus]
MRAGRLIRLREGQFTSADATPALLAEAAVRACRGTAISHRSAFPPHALPLVGVAPRYPEITTVPRGTGHVRGALLHRAALPPGHVVDLDGLPVTSVARTLIDVARSRPLVTAVAAIDAALHRHIVTEDELDDVVLTCWNWPGIRRAQRALRLADGRAESPLESVSRLVVRWLGLPAPDIQPLVLDERGVAIARLDFYWDEFGVAGEADGRAKYVDRDVLTSEKDRQEDVSDLGIEFARWQWWHATHRNALRGKIERAFQRGAARQRSGLPRRWSIQRTEPVNWGANLIRLPPDRPSRAQT